MKSTVKKLQGQWCINLALEEGDKLLPCPFCGGTELELQNTHTACYWVKCLVCGAEVTGASYGDGKGRKAKSQHRNAKADAISAWNRRTDAIVSDAMDSERTYCVAVLRRAEAKIEKWLKKVPAASPKGAILAARLLDVRGYIKAIGGDRG